MLPIEFVTSVLQTIEQMVEDRCTELTHEEAVAARFFYFSHIKKGIDSAFQQTREVLPTVTEGSKLTAVPGTSVDVYTDKNFIIQRSYARSLRYVNGVKVRGMLMQEGWTREKADSLVDECTVSPARQIVYRAIENIQGIVP